MDQTRGRGQGKIAAELMTMGRRSWLGCEMHTFCGGAKAADLAPIIKELRAAGKTSLSAVAAGLNDALF